jgi:DNA mismatch repair protein MutL
MSRINVLDDNMINMIAAGEVIERPASVVKELLENSIDAGAKRITLTVEDGGRRLISVTDDGCGMDAKDVSLAFTPHATSKIKNSDDLFNISTLGFRGEALASIAAVSEVTITSRTTDAIEANTLSIDCGDSAGVKPTSGAVGTTIEVRNLFYKLPARRKFLRTANTEMTHINEQFTRIGLSHRDLDLTLINNGRQVHRLTAGQPLGDRITALFSKMTSADLLETKSEEKGMKVYALLGRPAAARATSKFQYVFLNGRFIRDKFIGHAVKEAYRGLIEPNKYPVAFLFLQLDTGDFDVNVHPTKAEVRFTNSNLIHSQVLAVLREKLLSTNLDINVHLSANSPTLVENGGVPGEQEHRQERIRKAMADFFKNQKPSGGGGGGSGGGAGRTQGRFEFKPNSGSAAPPRQSYTPPPATEYTPMVTGVNQPSATSETSDPLNLGENFLQVHNSYIVTESDEGFVIVDQHALHERIIYEDLCRKVSSGQLQSQRMLIPETLEITDVQQDLLTENAELIAKLGIELSAFGPNTIAVQSFPTLLDKVSPVDFVQDLLDMLGDKTIAPDAERLLHEILDMAACKAAIKAGQSLTQQEMSKLLADKETVERASRCPHGRPTTIKFSIADLEKQFKRTGF